MSTNQIDLADLKRLANADSPDLPAVIADFVRQPDPQPEGNVPAGALTVQTFLQQMSWARGPYKDSEKRRAEVTALWQKFLGQTDPPTPPRFELADILEALYEDGREPARDAIVEIARTVPLVYGVWGGLKRIYKLAEERNDARIFGVLAYRFDVATNAYEHPREVFRGTLLYLRKRARRYLAMIERDLPDAFPQFAVETLRHYEGELNAWGTEVAKKLIPYQLFNPRHPKLTDKDVSPKSPWRASPAPLMFLLETCRADVCARFAIEMLRLVFPDELRKPTAAWLDRLARRPLPSVHDFLVDTLQASPEFHQGKLRGLGLHDTVLSLLLSPSAKARTYAIEYARANAQDLSPDQLAALLDAAFDDTRKFAASQLQGRDARALGYPFLGRLLAYNDTNTWARGALLKSFERKEIPDAFLADMFFGAQQQRAWVSEWLSNKYQPEELEPPFFIALLDDPRAAQNSQAVDAAGKYLEKFSPDRIGAAWLLEALTKDHVGQLAARILRKASSLPGLDIERVKGLVFNVSLRGLALEVLGNKKLVKPKDLTLPWLLALARRPDPSLQEFAHRYLLENMKPDDFAEGGAKGAGVDRLFAMATGDKEPDSVRAFAQTYLRNHHPTVGPEQPEAKRFGLKQHLKHEDFSAARVWPALFDHRADVKRWAVSVAKPELRRWGYLTRVYELAESDVKEVRELAYNALLKVGEEGADEAWTLKADEIDSAKVFALTESRKRPTREVGMELIRRHYKALGGAEKLGWLMESPDREVRIFAVRLLWEKHRPKHLPAGWKPKGRFAGNVEESERFGDVEALRGFLRTMLFGLPPGRNPDTGEEKSGVRKHIPASVAKRNVIEIVRDLGLEDEAFARVVAPVLGEFSGSIAKGEWQACLSALARLSSAHPGAVTLGGAA